MCGVTITYNNGHTALRDAGFCTPLGSITALVGVNGSGKSTLFKAIMGFLKPAAGTIQVLGQSVSSAIGRNLVAYVPQNEEVDWDFPVLVQDVVMMGRYGHMGFFRRPRPADREAVDQALQRVQMDELRHRQIGELSGGQKKRVFLARALAQQAKVILLDEPFTGVDVKTEDAIIELQGAARRRLRDSRLHPQPGQRARVLRPHGAGEEHGAHLRPHRAGLYPPQSGAGLWRRAAPLRPAAFAR